MKPTRAAGTNGTKIIVQYRAKGGKIYELKNAEASLVVQISPDESPGNPVSWHVQARSDAGVLPSSVDGWGPTPADALREVARAWASHSPTLTAFDWDAVTHELHVVQAV